MYRLGWHTVRAGNLVNPVNPVYFCSAMIQKDSPETEAMLRGSSLRWRHRFPQLTRSMVWALTLLIETRFKESGAKGQGRGQADSGVDLRHKRSDRFFDNTKQTTSQGIAFGHWPAPLTTLSVLRDPIWPIELTAGTNSIGVRLPDDENCPRAFARCGGALTRPARIRRDARRRYGRGS